MALAKQLIQLGTVTVCLNRNQHQGRLYRTAISDKLPDTVKVVDVFESIGDLLAAVAAFDYVVMADSGRSSIACSRSSRLPTRIAISRRVKHSAKSS